MERSVPSGNIMLSPDTSVALAALTGVISNTFGLRVEI